MTPGSLVNGLSFASVIGATWYLASRLTRLDSGLAGVDARVTALDARVAHLDGRVTALDGRVTHLDNRVTRDLESLAGRFHAFARDTRHEFTEIKGVVSTLITELTGSGAIASGAAVEAALAPWMQQVEREQRERNPLTDAELERYERYYHKVARHEPLEEEEFQDYGRITDKLYDDRPDDRGIWILLGLKTLLPALGLVKPSRK